MIRVALVEDDLDLNEMFSDIITNSSDCTLVQSFSDGETAAKQLPKLNPEIVLMDVNLPNMSGIETVRALKTSSPDTQAVMLTIQDDEQTIFQALSAGACGYLNKNISPIDLIKAIKDIKNGGAPMSTNIARLVIQSFHSQENLLSNRESSVLKLLGQGMSYKLIADDLNLSIDTIRRHIKKVYSKLQVKKRSDALDKAKKQGLI